MMKINQSTVSKPFYMKTREQWKIVKKDERGKTVDNLYLDTKEEADTIYIHLLSQQNSELEVESINSDAKVHNLPLTDVKVKLLRAQDVAFDMLVEGKSRDTIMANLMAKFSVSYSHACQLMKEVVDTVALYSLTNIDDIIPIHIKRYEDIYSVAEKLGFDKLALKALKAKEQLVGITSGDFDTFVDNMEFIDDYSFEDIQLNQEESNEFESIMLKAKIK